MTLEGLSWIVITNGVVQLTGLVVMIVIAVYGLRKTAREHHELMRLSRGVAGSPQPFLHIVRL